MTRMVVEHQGRLFTVSPDDPTPAARRRQTLLRARLVDELTNTGTSRGASLHTAAHGLTPRVGGDGIAGFIGIPVDAFPDLDTIAYDVDIEIRGDWFIPETRRETLVVQGNFPDDFQPHDFGDVPLHVKAVTIEGRVVNDDGVTRTPVPNAPVEITEMWRTLPTVSVPSPALPPNLVSITPPLYADRDTATGIMNAVTMTPAGGNLRLMAPARAGEETLRLANSTNLFPGDVVEVELLDAALLHHDPVKVEYLRIDAIERVDQSLPSTLTFELPLAFDHDENVLARLVNPQFPGGNLPLARRALATEQCLFPTNLAGLPGAQTIEVRGGTDLDGNPLPTEYHRVFLFDVTSLAAAPGPEGFFRFPPISRVAQVTIQTTIGPDTVTKTFNPDYSLPVNRCDLVHVI